MDTYLDKHAAALKDHLKDGFEYVPNDQQIYQRYTDVLGKRQLHFGLVQVKSMMVHDVLPVQVRIMDGDDEYLRDEAILFRSEYDRYLLLDPVSATRTAESLLPDGYSADEIEKWWNNRLFAPSAFAFEAGIDDDGVGWDTLAPTSQKARAGEVAEPHIQSVIEGACVRSGQEKIWIAEHWMPLHRLRLRGASDRFYLDCPDCSCTMSFPGTAKSDTTKVTDTADGHDADDIDGNNIDDLSKRHLPVISHLVLRKNSSKKDSSPTIQKMLESGVFIDTDALSSLLHILAHAYFCRMKNGQRVRHLPPIDFPSRESELKERIRAIRAGNIPICSVDNVDDPEFEDRYTSFLHSNLHYAALEIMPKQRLVIVYEGLGLEAAFVLSVKYVLYKFGFVQRETAIDFTVLTRSSRNAAKSVPSLDLSGKNERWLYVNVEAYLSLLPDHQSRLYKHCGPRPLVVQGEPNPSLCGFLVILALLAIWECSDLDMPKRSAGCDPTIRIESSSANELIIRKGVFHLFPVAFEMVLPDLRSEVEVRSKSNSEGDDDMVDLLDSDDPDDNMVEIIDSDSDSDLDEGNHHSAGVEDSADGASSAVGGDSLVAIASNQMYTSTGAVANESPQPLASPVPSFVPQEASKSDAAAPPNASEEYF